MKNKKMFSNLLLLITAIVWGSSFVAQKSGGAALGPFTYNGIRTVLAAVCLIPVVLIMRNSRAKKGEAQDPEKEALIKRTSIIGGICCGLALCVAGNLQQFGMYFDVDAGKAGFITALYIVIVPLLGLFVGKRPRLLIWICVIMGAIGFYLLTMAGKSEGFSMSLGEGLVLACAVAYSVHILIIDKFTPNADGVLMSCIQFFVAGGISCICMFIFENPVLKDILAAWLPIAYAGIMSSGIGYTLQIIGQKHAEPAAASLILSLESVFSVIAGALLLHERMTGFEIIGCVVIFAAVIASQLPEKNPEKLS